MLDPRVIKLRHAINRGIGASIKTVCEYTLAHDYEILVVQAGHDKDEPLEIPAKMRPLVDWWSTLRPIVDLGLRK